jgi:hypothetical protein
MFNGKRCLAEYSVTILDLWRGTAVIRGTVHPEGKMLVQHDMHSIPRHFHLQYVALLPRVSVALFLNRVPEIACLSNTTIIFRVRVVHTALLSLRSRQLSFLVHTLVAMPGLTERDGR